MANPNILQASTVLGKTSVVDLTTTNATLVVENPAGSNKIVKVDSLYVSNVDGFTGAQITISLYSEDNIGGTATEICRVVNVPAGATLVVIDRTSCVYLEEDKSIGATASLANDLKIVCSYEEIS